MTNQPAPSDTPTLKTDAVAKMIGRLAYQLKAGDIDLTSFALLAQSELDKLGNMERELTRLSAEREKPTIGIITALKHFVEAVELYDTEGVWPDNHTIRKLADEGRRALNGGPDDGPCAMCGEQTNSLHGNPGLWPLHFPKPNGTGKLSHWHTHCVVKAIATLDERDRQLAEAKRALAMAIDAANKGDDARCKAGAMQDMIEDLQAQLATSERQSTGLLSVAQLAYRKHHLDDPDIGWNELGDKLCNALCNAMTDEGFQAWLKTVSNNES